MLCFNQSKVVFLDHLIRTEIVDYDKHLFNELPNMENRLL